MNYILVCTSKHHWYSQGGGVINYFKEHINKIKIKHRQN